jgi:hypothetical protein
MPGIVCQYAGFEISRIASRDRVDGASHRDGFDILAIFLCGLQELFVSVARLSALSTGLARQNHSSIYHYTPFNRWSQEISLIVSISWIVQQGRRNMYHIVEIIFLENVIPNAFAGIILDLDKVEFTLPFGVKGEKLGTFAAGADSAGNGVAGINTGFDDVDGNEPVGTSDESLRH